MKILVVDDNEDNLDLIEAILSEEGYENIMRATSAEEMFEILKREKPDLILLDIMLPGMDGYEACRRLKQSEEWRDIPVIMVTAKTSPEDLKRGFEVGAIDYIEKPINDVELLARVESALKTKLEIDRYKSKEVEPTRAFKLIRDIMQLNDSKISLINEIISDVMKSNLNDTLKDEIVRELRVMKDESIKHRQIFEDLMEGLI